MRMYRGLAVLAASLVVLTGCAGSTEQVAGDGYVNPPGPGRTSNGDREGGDGRGGNAGNHTLTQQSFAAAVTKAQLKQQTAHITADVSAAGAQMTMTGDVRVGDSPADYAADITMSAPSLGDGLRMVIVDQVLYLDMGEATAGKYVRLDLTDTSSPLAQMMSQVLRSADPSGSIAGMRNSITDFEKVGTERVDGVQTTQYRVEVDSRKALAAQGMADLPGVDQLPDTLTYDMWIGADDLIRRMSFAMGMTMTMTMDITQWGEPVRVTAPPPGQITKTDPFAGMPAG